MASQGLNCWHCGASLKGLPLPLGRREECHHCAASMHVCRMCDFFDPQSSKGCREPMADEVADKEQANFCDYFRPRAGLSAKVDRAVEESRKKLDALFGSKPTGGAAAGGSPPAAGAAQNAEADAARKKLEKLFGGE